MVAGKDSSWFWVFIGGLVVNIVLYCVILFFGYRFWGHRGTDYIDRRQPKFVLALIPVAGITISYD